MGMSRFLLRALRYGPLEVGGVGLRDLYLVMGMLRIQYLLEHLWKDTPTSDLIRTNWENLSLEAGILGSLFVANYEVLKSWLLVTTDSWVLSTLQFIRSEHISFSSDLNFPTIEPKRIRDSSIMLGLSRVVDSAAALHRLNQCRIFLRVNAVSNISNAAGTCLPYRSLRRNCYL